MDKKEVLIVIGAGNIGHSDIEQLKYLGDVLVVGNAIKAYSGHIDAYAAWRVDGQMFNTALEQRKNEGLNTDFPKYSFMTTGGFEHLPLPLHSAGDGMYGVQLGIYFDYEKIILADCPLDDKCEGDQEGWKEAYESLKDKVRSMSGFTKELFGEPTDEWIGTAFAVSKL